MTSSITLPGIDTLWIAGTIFFSVYLLAVIIYLGFARYLRFQEKKLDLEFKSRLTLSREHAESSTLDINERYTRTNKQWKDANGVILSSHSRSANPSVPHSPPKGNQFISAHGLTERDLEVDQDLIFVLTPFLDEFIPTFRRIRSIAQDIDLTCKRGDEEKFDGDIFPHILQYIAKARLIIANITGRSPNVLYELGIAHALDKPVILLARHAEELPIDLRTKSVIFYKDDDDLENKLKDALLKIFRKNAL